MNTAPQIGEKTETEVRNVSISFLNRLDSGELLTGTPDISVSPSGLTLGTPTVNASAIYINGRLHAAGQAVQFKVEDGDADTAYTVSVYCNTTGDQYLGGAVIVAVK